jgi:peptidoglycan/xylan/chitin deacetylase (PgdA/CDA1 family)
MFLSKKSTLEIVTSVKLNGSAGHQAIALSFDDGPDWGEESLVLALNRAGMKVTFFWTWQKIQLLRQADAGRFIRLVRLIIEGGHEIGIHGISCDTPSNLPERFKGVTGEFENLGLIRKNFSGLLKQNPGLYRPHCFQGSTKLLQAVRTS